MYFSMQDERQVCSLEESEVEGEGMQVAKQFLDVIISVVTGREEGAGRGSVSAERFGLS